MDSLWSDSEARAFVERYERQGVGEDLARRTVLDLYGREGRAPSKAALAADTGMDAASVSMALARLRSRDILVLDADTGEITGAYPFTDNETGHRVRLGAHVLNAMCAIDALGAGAMYGRDVAIESTCRRCAAPVRLTTRDNGAALDDISPSPTVVLLTVAITETSSEPSLTT